MLRGLLMLAVAIVLTAGLAGPVTAQEAGRIKVSSGTVQIERGGQKLPGTVGTAVQAGDVISTGSNGSVGITFLLAAPVMNPIVLASTYAAFGWGPVLIGRLAAAGTNTP